MIIGGCVLFSLLIFFTKIYKDKIHIYRAMFNCAVIALIEVMYIISQKDTIEDNGSRISITVIALLGGAWVTNIGGTAYLFRV